MKGKECSKMFREVIYADLSKKRTMKDVVSMMSAGYQYQGVETDGCYTGLVVDYLSNEKQIKKNKKAISLLNSWMEDTNSEHIADQTKSLAELKKTEDKQS